MKPLFSALKIKIPPSYYSYALLSVSILLCVFAILTFFRSNQKLQSLEAQIDSYCCAVHLRNLKQEEEAFFLNKLKQADPYYVDKYLENLSFLEEEIAGLQMQLRTSPSDEKIRERLRHLKEGSNQLRFSEENLHRAGTLQEVEENQQHPIEINLSDLKKLLSRIEGVSIPPFNAPERAPQIIVKNFDLFKKPLSAQEETYLIQMKLIKREAVHE